MKKESIYRLSFLQRRVFLKDTVFEQISNILNQIHQVNYSERFWSIILDPYAKALINDRDKLKNETNNLLIPAEICGNTLLPIKKTVRYLYFLKMVKYFKAIGHKNLIFESLKKHDVILTGFHDSYSVPDIPGCFVKPYYNFLPYIKINNKLRLPVKEMITVEVEEFSGHFWNNAIKHMPKVYLEDFKRIYDSIPLINPKDKTFHISMLESTFMRILIAKYVENGSKLIYYQHGGFYGEYDYNSAHLYESSISDKYMTWGWKMLPNDTPNYAHRLKFFIEKYNEIYKQQFKFDLVLVFPPVDAKMQFMIEAKDFFREIDRDKYKTICLRPRPVSKLNRKGELVFFKDKDVYIDSGYIKLVNLIAVSKVVVQFTYPSTNLFECLSVNHPVVALLENDRPSDIVKHHYEYLLSVGVFHLDIQSLVAHLNTVNVPEWWAGIISSEEYIAFKREFLNLKTD